MSAPRVRALPLYEAHGHGERVYAIRPWLEHVLAGVQYALGDLQADATPRPRTE